MVSDKIDWLNREDIRPYIYMRSENRFKSPGTYHQCDWFKQEPIYKNPLMMSEVGFGDQILKMESLAFTKADMQMPRWVFYDCAIVPGFVCGFAQKTKTLSHDFIQRLKVDPKSEWTPLSLFIIIPTIRDGEWVAHNLCTTNSIVEKQDQHYALGYLTKAFGLWYANVQILCGMTQWKSPSIRLHSHYGPFEVLTAFTPIHSHARTLTYRCPVDVSYWPSFFTKEVDKTPKTYVEAGFQVDPDSEESIIQFQKNIEAGRGPFYLSPYETRTQSLDSPLTVYHLAKSEMSLVK